MKLPPETIALLRDQHIAAKGLEASLDNPPYEPNARQLALGLAAVVKGLIALQETLIEAAEAWETFVEAAEVSRDD